MDEPALNGERLQNPWYKCKMRRHTLIKFGHSAVIVHHIVRSWPVMFVTLLLRILAVFADYGCNVYAVDYPPKPLYIGGLLPLSEKDGWTRFFGHSALVGAQHAVQDINNRSDVLPNYTLVLDVYDTEGYNPVTFDRLYEMLYDPPVKTAIFGPMLSSSTEVVAQVLSRWHVVEMCPGVSSPILSDRDKFPHLFRMITSAAGFSSAQVELCRVFGWNKIATLHQAKEPHVGVTNELQRLVSASNYSIIAAESFYNDPYEAIARLKSKDARIILSSFYEGMVQKVFCSIFKLDMYGPNYVWMIPGYYSANWWNEKKKDVDCSKEELKRASEGYLAVAWSKYGMSDKVGISGMTPEEFRHEIADDIGYEVLVTDHGSAGVGYDGIWALALAMEKAEVALSRGLDSFEYRDEDFAHAIGASIYQLSFDGVSGPVAFSDGGDRIGDLLIEQNIDGQEVIVGTYDNIHDLIVWKISTEELWYYSGGEPPFDSDITETVEHLQGTPILLVAAMGVLAALGMILAVMFLVFNISKRHNRQIKMSSPRVNNIIACGIMLAYLCVVLLGIDRSMVEEDALIVICTMRCWIIALAFTLAFGGMFTKMWRVYSVVIANKTKRKVIKDYYLFGIIAVLLLIDFAVLVPWQVIDPIHIEGNRVAVSQTAEDIEHHIQRQSLYVVCTSHNNTMWTLILIIYKAFVVVFGAFLAWSTRNIRVSGLNDSYYVGLSIYNTVICCVVAVPFSVLNLSSIAVTYALVSGFLFLCITVSQCMLFFPKVIAVYRKNAISDENFTGTKVSSIMTAPKAVGEPGMDVPTTSGGVESKTTSGGVESKTGTSPS